MYEDLYIVIIGIDKSGLFKKMGVLAMGIPAD